MRRSPRWRRPLGCLAALLGLSALLLVLHARLLGGIGHWLATAPPPPDHPAVVVVLSGGGPSRLLPGIAAFEASGASELWYTGNQPTAESRTFTDARFARDFAIEQGVDPSAIRLLDTASTWEDGEEIAALVEREEVHLLLVVTDWNHVRRAHCVIRYHLGQNDATVGYLALPDADSRPSDWWQSEEGLVGVTSELLKTAFYWSHYGLAPWEC